MVKDRRTDFGFERVTTDEKTRRVRGVFDSVADRYDLMNDLMSFGLHRLWKRLATMAALPRPGQRVLDLAGGTGDMTRLLAKAVGDGGEVVLSDLNAAMLAIGRDKLLDKGVSGNVTVVQANAEALPFDDCSFDLAIIAFGLRNVTDKDSALGEAHRVIRPGGRFLVLEFSRVQIRALQKVYDHYSFKILPELGRRVAGDADSYRYLAESIRMHPDQVQLAESLAMAGFEKVRYRNFGGGVVALHDGLRL